MYSLKAPAAHWAQTKHCISKITEMQHSHPEYPLFHAVLDQLFPEGL